MTIYPIDESQRKAARVAGFAYLVTFATVVYVNFGIHDRLIVANNAAETARNILRRTSLRGGDFQGMRVYRPMTSSRQRATREKDLPRC